jgi:hypothetical protein
MALRIVLGWGLPTVQFFQSRYSKKLVRTAYEFSRGPGPWEKAFLLRSNVDYVPLKLLADSEETM